MHTAIHQAVQLGCSTRRINNVQGIFNTEAKILVDIFSDIQSDPQTGRAIG